MDTLNTAAKGVNEIGVGWTNRGYIDGVFFVLLYPALARRMQLLLVPLVVPLQGQCSVGAWIRRCLCPRSQG